MLKFTALFYNREADAEALYDAIASEYSAVKDLQLPSAATTDRLCSSTPS